MIRVAALSTLLLLLGLPSARANDACPDVERVEGPPVYVVLFGYPHGKRDQKSLAMVDHDLLHMSRFFGALGPEHVWIHAEPEGSLLSRFGPFGVRAASWRTLLGSISELIERLAKHDQRPRVYLYFSGHGNRSARSRLELYARPEPDATEPGYNGVLDSALVAREILGPIAVHADVHLLADTCFSYYFLQTRRMRRLTRVKSLPPSVVFDEVFVRDFPGVGALLATMGGVAATYENRREGGLFSHAVRSVALGPGDLNGDGVVTYGEMDFALAWLSEGSAHLNRPAAVPPGLDHDAVFIDWRATNAARVCPSASAGKRYLLDNGSLFATANLGNTTTPLWLARGHTFAVAEDAEPTLHREFIADNGPMSVTRETRGIDMRGQLLPEFFPTAVDGTGYDPSRPPIDDSLPFQVAAGLTVSGSFTGGDTFAPGAAAGTPHVDLSTRVGYHRHRLLLEGAYTRWRIIEVGQDSAGAEPEHVKTHALGGRLGYGVLVHEGDLEVEAGILGGLHWLWPDAPVRWTTQEAAVRVAVLWPWADYSPWAWRFEGQVGMMRLDEWVGPTLRLGVGLDYELLIE